MKRTAFVSLLLMTSSFLVAGSTTEDGRDDVAEKAAGGGATSDAILDFEFRENEAAFFWTVPGSVSAKEQYLKYDLKCDKSEEVLLLTFNSLPFLGGVTSSKSAGETEKLPIEDVRGKFDAVVGQFCAIQAVGGFGVYKSDAVEVLLSTTTTTTRATTTSKQTFPEEANSTSASLAARNQLRHEIDNIRDLVLGFGVAILALVIVLVVLGVLYVRRLGTNGAGAKRRVPTNERLQSSTRSLRREKNLYGERQTPREGTANHGSSAPVTETIEMGDGQIYHGIKETLKEPSAPPAEEASSASSSRISAAFQLANEASSKRVKHDGHPPQNAVKTDILPPPRRKAPKFPSQEANT